MAMMGCAFAGNEQPDEQFAYKLVSRVEAHKRIIWACSWSPCDRFFATGSRDKCVKIWVVCDEEGGCTAKQIGILPVFKSSVTAVAWAPCTIGESYLLGIGLEDGLLEIWKVKPIWVKTEDEKVAPCTGNLVGFESSRFLQFNAFLCHTASVNRLAWKESNDLHKKLADGASNWEHMKLASCGADHAVRVFSFKCR